MAARFSVAPIRNESENPHTPVALRVFSDGTCFWNIGRWELSAGAMLSNSADGQTPLRLPEEFPTPVRAQLRIVRVSENEWRKSSVERPQFSFSCVGRVMFHSMRYSTDGNEMHTAAFSRATAWSAGLSPRYICSRQHFNLATGDPIGGILKSDFGDPCSAVVRNWWPLTKLELQSAQPSAYWPPDDLYWSFPQIFELLRISRPQLFPNNFKFEMAQAFLSYAVTFEDAAGAMGKYVRKGNKKTPPPPPPPPDDEEDEGDYHTSWDRQASNKWRGVGRDEPPEPKEWVQMEGQ